GFLKVRCIVIWRVRVRVFGRCWMSDLDVELRRIAAALVDGSPAPTDLVEPRLVRANPTREPRRPRGRALVVAVVVVIVALGGAVLVRRDGTSPGDSKRGSAATSAVGRATITEFWIPSYAQAPSVIVVGPDGNLWFPESGRDKIGRIRPDGTI